MNASKRSFYLGATRSNKVLASGAIANVASMGYECAFDWPQVVEDYAELPLHQLNAVKAADFCVFLVFLPYWLPSHEMDRDMLDLHVEIGASLALGKPTYILRLTGFNKQADIPFYKLGISISSLQELEERLQEYYEKA